MHPITSSSSGDRPHKDGLEAVSNLQEALVFLLLKDPAQFVFSDAVDVLKLGQQVEREAALGTFGSATTEVLKGFQRASELEDSGEVDEWTAYSMNAVLLRWVFTYNPFQRFDLASARQQEALSA